MKIIASNFPDFHCLKIEIELDGVSDFDFDMNWERPAEHGEIEILDDDIFGIDRLTEYGPYYMVSNIINASNINANKGQIFNNPFFN